ncbi:MAG: tetratricopeptide repeat protein [Acidobacteria bacterium]|nr:tetratricopeptide repeat protein [Acidobacteriota bacterium]
MEKRATIDFTRDPGTLSLPGFRARSQETLRQQIENAGLPGTWVAADLSLGAWRGQQVAREFFAQLALELPSSEFAVADWHRAAPPREISYADIIGEFIDAEALGDRATVESLNFAQRIRERVQGVAPYLFLVIAPRAALPWENENLLFIRFLAQALRATPSKIALVAADADDPAVPADWEIDWQGSREPPPVTVAGDILGLVPGVSSPEMRLALAAADLPPAAALIPLANGYCLVPPERRRRPQDVARLEFDRLGALARPFGWLDAYAQFHGNNMYVEPWFLYTEGQRRLAEGGLGITLRLLERALTKLRIGLDWGIFQSYAQGLRVASQRFAEAANIPDPPAVLPPEMRSFLLQSKGWGYVMTGNLACAEACFQQACSFADPAGQERREYLYLLNIFALCRLKAGDITQALALEKEIEERTARLPFPDRRLQYVNSINLARLYRRRQEFEQAEQYFNAAFSTTLGARSESDALYANLILARLAAERGNHREAFSAWMRAGLHWAASNAPEAVGARVVSSLLGKSAKFEGSMPEAVSASIAASLLAAAALSGSAEIARALQNAKPATLPAPVFARTEQLRQVLPAAGFHCALLGPGFAVLGMHNPLTPQIADRTSGNSGRYSSPC